ncbi:MAG TPA: hypothetical protein VMU51_38265 [Mycobacteriales bacterium]|nr:hypothetical protein [Mycobacteriales bacterium]
MHLVAGPGVPEAIREHAATMIRELVEAVARPVRYAQVVLTLDEDPAHQRSALVEASLDVVGAPVRACVAAADLCQAIEQVGAVLLRRVQLQAEWVTTRLHAAGGPHRADSGPAGRTLQLAPH